MKVLTGLLITGAVVAVGARAAMALKRASERSAVQLSGRVHKLTTQGVVVALGFNIKNPTRATLKMSIPLITVKYGNTELAQSSLSQVDVPPEILTSAGHIRIDKFKETGMIFTEVTLPYFSLLSAGYDLVKKLKGRLNGEGNKIKFNVTISSQTFTSIGSYAYDEKQTISL